MCGFCAELPMEVVKEILLKHYGVLDKYHEVWYNQENNTLVIGLQDDKTRNESRT